MGGVGISVAHEGERFTVLLRSAEIEMARRFLAALLALRDCVSWFS